MRNPKNVQNQKILEVLDQLNLSEAELETAETYLAGEAGEGGLERFAFRNLERVQPDKAVKLFRDYMRKGRKEEADRLFRLLFAVGQSTCYKLVPMDVCWDGNGGFLSDADKKAAVYAVHIGTSPYHLFGYALRNLIRAAGDSAENLKRAVGYQKNDADNGKLILLAVYFTTRYGNFKTYKDTGAKGIKEEKPNKRNLGFLGSLGKFFGGRRAEGKGEEAPVEIEPEDMPLMERYEEIILSSLENLYDGRMDVDSLEKLKEAVRQNCVTDEILQLAGSKGSVSDFLLLLLGGMAYLNFLFSLRLRNIVRLCLAVDTEKMLDIMERVSEQLPAIVLHEAEAAGGVEDKLFPINIRTGGGEYDEIFGIDTARYIRWAAMKGHRMILKKQLEHHQECYLKVMDEALMEHAGTMLDVVRTQNKPLYDKLTEEKQQSGRSREMERMIASLVENNAVTDVVKDYLRGETKADTLYPYLDQIRSRFYYDTRGWHIVEEYMKNFRDEEFLRRCQVYMLLKNPYSLHDSIMKNGEADAQRLRTLFGNFDAEGLTVAQQLSGLVWLHDSFYLERHKMSFLDGAAGCFAVYLRERRDETVSAFSSAEAVGRFFGLRVLSGNPEAYKKEILAFSQDGSKAVKEELLNILRGQREWEVEVTALLASKKAAERELAIRVLLGWQGEDGTCNGLFAQMLEKEKNSKVRDLLSKALKLEEEGVSGAKALTQEDMVKEIHKGGKKRSLAWAYETPFSKVHRQNGGEAEEEYLQAILLCYAAVDGCGVSSKAAMLAGELQPEELAVYVNELFDKWVEAGAEAKKRWVLYASSIHGGSDIVKKLQHQIQEWPQQARGAIAAEAVQALSLNPLPQALLLVDGISRKFKFKQVKAAAGKALEFAAAQLGISREELEDRIVPDLGFDEKGERSFDYGERRFKVSITPVLELEVYDETGKKLKNMPSPGKRDEEAKAAASYEAFKQMKKQMKMTVSSQKMRLELALSSGRKWSAEAWKQLFVKNPVMHQFAIGLIWGVYGEKELVQSFRYMEDGSFNTEEEEEYELPEDGRIGLVHPVELSEGEREVWKQQMEDYEIRQPIEQLERDVYLKTEEEAEMQRLERFGGCILNDLSLGGKLQGLGWYRGPVEDGGCFDTYYRVDEEAGIGVQLHFSGSFVGGENEEVTVYHAEFYPAEEIKRGYVYRKEEKEKAFFLKEIPDRYFSETVWQLTKATASGKEREEDWRSEAL